MRTTDCKTVNYFAYGSNINLSHLRWYLALHQIDLRHHIGRVRHSILHGYYLRTNYLTWDASGACNVEPAEGHVVEGLVMTITEQVRNVLRIKEGWPTCYDETQVEVLVGSKSVTAMTYIVAPERRLPRDVPVSHEYRELILEGSRDAGFSRSYQEQLCRVLKTTPQLVKK